MTSTKLPALDEKEIGRLVDAMAPMLGLSIKPEWRDDVVANLKVTSLLAASVLEFPITDEAEPAEVFRP